MPEPTSLRVALDWTPNTLHTGLFIAQAKNLYTTSNLSVTLLSPGPSYTTTPAKLLSTKAADLAICPSESCIAYNETSRLRLQAIYAILAHDASAIVSCTPEFKSLESLGGGTYGSYNAKYEDHIVRAMVRNAGGASSEAMKIKSSVGKLSLFEEMKLGTVDATWVFLPWEGVEAELEGIKLNVFRTEDYGVPYGYSPVIARDADAGVDEDALRRFVQATRKGYEYAIEHPEEAAQIMLEHCDPKRSKEFLEKSQRSVNEFYSDGEVPIGAMKKEKWVRWVQWLKDQGLLKGDVEIEDVFTSQFSG